MTILMLTDPMTGLVRRDSAYESDIFPFSIRSPYCVCVSTTRAGSWRFLLRCRLPEAVSMVSTMRSDIRAAFVVDACMLMNFISTTHILSFTLCCNHACRLLRRSGGATIPLVSSLTARYSVQLVYNILSDRQEMLQAFCCIKTAISKGFQTLSCGRAILFRHQVYHQGKPFTVVQSSMNAQRPRRMVYIAALNVGREIFTMTLRIGR